jgi:hypothetical protein
VFDHYRALLVDPKTGEYIKKQRAFWRFLARQPHRKDETEGGYTGEDYYSVCDFLDAARRISSPEQYKALLENNYDIATTLDFYRFCILRELSGAALPTAS